MGMCRVLWISVPFTLIYPVYFVNYVSMIVTKDQTAAPPSSITPGFTNMVKTLSSLKQDFMNHGAAIHPHTQCVRAHTHLRSPAHTLLSDESL